MFIRPEPSQYVPPVRRPASLLTPVLRTFLTVCLVLGVFMAGNTVYLLLNRLADAAGWRFFAIGEKTIPKVFQAMLVSHTFVGLVFTVLMLLFAVLHLPRVWKRHRPRTVFSGVALIVTGLALSVTGLFIMTAAATRNNSWAWWVHVSCAALAPTMYIVHRGVSFVPAMRRDYVRFSGAVAALLAVVVTAHMFSKRDPALTKEALLALSKDAHKGPGAKQRDVGDYVESKFVPAAFVPTGSPFFPSAATTTTGDYLPSRIITRDDLGKKEQLQADLDKYGFAKDTLIGADTCNRCHQDIVDQWSKSAHRFASFNNPFYEATINDMRENANVPNKWVEEHVKQFPDVAERIGMVKSKWCSGCHDPSLMLAGKMDEPIDRATPEAQAGLTCLACHAINQIHNTTGNANYNIADETEDPYIFPEAEDKTLAAYLHDLAIKAKPTVHMRQMKKEFFGKSDFCATCHKVNLNVPVNNYRWFRGQNDFDAWHDSGVALNASRTFYRPPKARQCQDCHMPPEPAPLGDVAAKNGMVRSHRFLAVNTALPFIRGDEDTLKRTEEFMQTEKLTVDVFAVTPDGADGPIMAVERSNVSLAVGARFGFDVVVRNLGVGHTFPGGTNDSNEGWLEVTVTDESGRQLAVSGAIQDDGYLDPYAHLYKSIMLDHWGNRISRRNAQDIHVAAFARVIGPGTADVAHYAFTPPPELAGQKIKIKSKLQWRKFDRPYTEFAYKKNPQAFKRFDECPDLPVTTIAEDEITLQIAAAGATIVPAETVQDEADWMRYNDYGIGLFLQEDTRGAQRAFEMVAAVAPERLDGPRNLARVAIRDGKLDRAFAYLRENERIKPADAQTAWVWGVALQEDGRYEEAVLAYMRVLEDFPDDRAAWRNMGLSHRLNSNFDKAIEAFDRVLKIDPEDRVAHYHKIFCYRALGREEEAKKSEEAYELYQIDEAAQELTQKFRLENPGVNFETQLIHVHELNAPHSHDSIASAEHSHVEKVD